MSKKLSFILLPSTTLLFISTIIGILVFRIVNISNHAVSTYDQLTTNHAIDSTQSQQISGKININTATYEDLLQLPGIGKVLAERIIDYRNNHGKFQVIDELLEISGIGAAKLDGIKDYITIGG